MHCRYGIPPFRLSVCIYLSLFLSSPSLTASATNSRTRHLFSFPTTCSSFKVARAKNKPNGFARLWVHAVHSCCFSLLDAIQIWLFLLCLLVIIGFCFVFCLVFGAVRLFNLFPGQQDDGGGEGIRCLFSARFHCFCVMIVGYHWIFLIVVFWPLPLQFVCKINKINWDYCWIVWTNSQLFDAARHTYIKRFQGYGRQPVGVREKESIYKLELYLVVARTNTTATNPICRQEMCDWTSQSSQFLAGHCSLKPASAIALKARTELWPAVPFDYPCYLFSTITSGQNGKQCKLAPKYWKCGEHLWFIPRVHCSNGIAAVDCSNVMSEAKIDIGLMFSVSACHFSAYTCMQIMRNTLDHSEWALCGDPMQGLASNFVINWKMLQLYN